MKALVDLQDVQDFHKKLMNEFSHTVIGYEKEIKLVLSCLLANGHTLLEGVPGIAKTTIARALGKALNLEEGKGYRRIQCTPDLMPSDLVGTLVYDVKTGEFRPHLGPVFTNLLLVDEINRAVPRTQSALLQAMQEREVTIGGVSHRLDEPFFVIATQNPIEQEGTYPLPEAQLDRFMMKVKMGYPSTFEDEMDILDLHEKKVSEPIEEFSSVIHDPKDICEMQKMTAEEITTPPIVKHYVVEIIRYTRARDEIAWGASPRAGIFMMKAAKRFTAISGRDTTQIEDVDEVAYAVLNHRIILKAEKVIEGVKPENVIKEVLRVAKKSVEKIV